MSANDSDDQPEVDWRTHFGFLDREAGEAFAEAVNAGRAQLDEDVADRRRDVRAPLDVGNDRKQ